jgi:lysozyme
MPNLIEQIKESEGFRPTVYQCTEGYDTIGYGFAIKDLVLGEDICEIILERKIAELKLRIQQKLPFYDDMPEKAQDVIVEMCYQMGINGFSKFKKTIDHLMRKDYKAASVEMLDSRWAKQTPNRAKKLSNQMKNVR